MPPGCVGSAVGFDATTKALANQELEMDPNGWELCSTHSLRNATAARVERRAHTREMARETWLQLRQDRATEDALRAVIVGTSVSFSHCPDGVRSRRYLR